MSFLISTPIKLPFASTLHIIKSGINAILAAAQQALATGPSVTENVQYELNHLPRYSEQLKLKKVTDGTKKRCVSIPHWSCETDRICAKIPGKTL